MGSSCKSSNGGKHGQFIVPAGSSSRLGAGIRIERVGAAVRLPGQRSVAPTAKEGRRRVPRLGSAAKQVRPDQAAAPNRGRKAADHGNGQYAGRRRTRGGAWRSRG